MDGFVSLMQNIHPPGSISAAGMRALLLLLVLRYRCALLLAAVKHLLESMVKSKQEFLSWPAVRNTRTDLLALRLLTLAAGSGAAVQSNDGEVPKAPFARVPTAGCGSGRFLRCRCAQHERIRRKQ